MNLSTRILIILFMVLVATLVSCTNASDHILVNCGLPDSENATISEGLRWESDGIAATFSPSDIESISWAATASGGSTIRAPYTHARIFRSPLTYSFVVSQGPKFIRLYFTTSSTITYTNISATQSFVSLTANEFTLLTNFSAFLDSKFINSYSADGSFIEFYVPVLGTILNLTFSSPKNNTGFVNAIEIVSVPDGLYLNNNGSQPPYPHYATDLPMDYSMHGMTSFQTVYRLVAGADVQATNDVDGLGRTWLNDESYIFGNFNGVTSSPTYHTDDSKIKFTIISPDAAPTIVYKSQRFMWKKTPDTVNDKMNLTWQFWVDSGFSYLLRLHLCENNKGVDHSFKRQFKVSINNLIEANLIDVFELTGGLGYPIYVDFIFDMDTSAAAAGDSSVLIDSATGKAQMLFTLIPYTNTVTKDVLLNGLEILKLNQSNGSLAAPNPPLAVIPTPPTAGKDSGSNDSKQRTLAIIGGAVGGAILIILVLAFFILCRQRANAMIPLPSDDTDKTKKNSWVPITSLASGSAGSNTTSGSTLPSDLCRRFTLTQIRVATSDFDESFIVGTGGFGKVYRGTIDGGTTTVAIKRLTATSKQGVNEFRNEIEMLSRLRHLHLVSLIGYCDDQGEMILVYEYMPRGTLRDHLMYKSSDISSTNKPLSWKQRLMICVGSARGLHYLHSGTKDLIIHRDVKSTNILLDEKWTAKVSDFGLSKVGPTSESGVGHVSTAVKGSFGYLDPEYIKRQRLTEKSDVYSFGVVLFEALCARPAVKPNAPKEQVNLAKWARSSYLSGTLQTIIDPNLAGQIAPESLTKFGEIAEMCVRDEGNQRPMMGDVVWALEFALQLQETAEKNNINDSSLEEYTINGADGGTTDDDMFSVTVDSGATEAMTVDKSNSNTSLSSHHMGIKSGSIFSEIMDPQAR